MFGLFIQRAAQNTAIQVQVIKYSYELPKIWGLKPGLQPSQLALRSCYAGVIVVVNINRDREHKHKYNREPIGRVCTLQTFPMLLHDRELAQL